MRASGEAPASEATRWSMSAQRLPTGASSTTRPERVSTVPRTSLPVGDPDTDTNAGGGDVTPGCAADASESDCRTMPMTRLRKYAPIAICQPQRRLISVGGSAGTGIRGSRTGRGRRAPESCSIGKQLHAVGRQELRLDIGGGFRTGRRAGPVPPADGVEGSLFAEDRHRRHGAGAEGDARSAHEPEPRWIGEPRSSSERVLDQTPPHRHRPDDADPTTEHPRARELLRR